MLYNDIYFGDFSLDVLRPSHHATERAIERKIPVSELLRPRSHINGYVNKIVSKDGLVITAYPRATNPRPRPVPENGRLFTFPKEGIPHFIGKLGVNIKRVQAEHNLKSMYFDNNDTLVAVPSSDDYNWAPVEEVIETARKRKYKSRQQGSAAKKDKK